MNVLEQRSIRWMIATGSMILVLGAVGATLDRAGPADQVPDSLSMRHGRAIVHELPIIRAHGPRQVPKFGRIPLED